MEDIQLTYFTNYLKRQEEILVETIRGKIDQEVRLKIAESTIEQQKVDMEGYVTQANETINELNAALTTKETEAKSLHEDVYHDEVTINEFRDQIVNLKKEVDAKNGEISKAHYDISTKEGELNSLDNLCQKYRRDFEISENNVVAVRKALLEAQETIVMLEDQIKAIHATEPEIEIEVLTPTEKIKTVKPSRKKDGGSY